jgi:hypothetical protein
MIFGSLGQIDVGSNMEYAVVLHNAPNVGRSTIVPAIIIRS